MKKILLIVILAIASGSAYSQRYDEIGLFVGGSYFSGDVHTSIVDDSKLSLGLAYRHNFNSRWAWRTDFRWAQLTGDDANSTVEFESQRNLSFQSNVYELSSTVEFNFFDFKPFKPQSYFQKSDIFTPYLLVGLSIFYHNPKAYLAGNLYELRPYATEGVDYSKVSVALPFGMGIKFRVSDRLIFGVSMEMRATVTDYLDDVSTSYPSNPSQMSKTARDLSNKTLESQGANGSSWGTQRGIAYNNDWFNYAGFTLTFNLKKNPSSCHFNPTK